MAGRQCHARSLLACARTGDAAGVADILFSRRGAGLVNHVNANGTGALYMASLEGHAALAELADGVEDVPKWVQHLSKRHDFIVQKLKGMQADEDGDELDEQAEEVDLVINENSFKFGRPVKPRQNAVPRANVQHQANTGAIVAAKPKQNQNQKSGRKLVV